MERKSKFTSKQKIEACEKYIKGQGSLCSISDELGITCQSFRRWLLIYKNNGKDCFEESNTNNSYSSEFKMKVIKEYLNGKGSFVDIAAKYNIADSMVISWVNVLIMVRWKHFGEHLNQKCFMGLNLMILIR